MNEKAKDDYAQYVIAQRYQAIKKKQPYLKEDVLWARTAQAVLGEMQQWFLDNHGIKMPPVEYTFGEETVVIEVKDDGK